MSDSPPFLAFRNTVGNKNTHRHPPSQSYVSPVPAFMVAGRLMGCKDLSDPGLHRNYNKIKELGDFSLVPKRTRTRF